VEIIQLYALAVVFHILVNGICYLCIHEN